MLQSITNAGASLLQNTALIAVNAIVGITVVSLTALTLIKNFEDTPEIRTLSCAVGIERSDFPEHAAKVKRLEADLKEMIAQRESIEGQLAGLRAVETAVDEITLFESHDDPNSRLEVTVGTVYNEFVNERPTPKHHFCYINLKSGKAGESRNLHFHSASGARSISASTLRKSGVTKKTLKYARSVCKPFVIGKS